MMTERNSTQTKLSAKTLARTGTLCTEHEGQSYLWKRILIHIFASSFLPFKRASSFANIQEKAFFTSSARFSGSSLLSFLLGKDV